MPPAEPGQSGVGRQGTPSEAQLDKEGREEREEWSVPRQQDGAFDRALSRFPRHNRIDGRYSDRQGSACDICEGCRDKRQGAGIAIAAAGHRRRWGRLGFVAPVMGSDLTRHVSRTRNLIAVKGAERQRQRGRAQEHGDNRQYHPRPMTCRQGHLLPVLSKGRTDPAEQKIAGNSAMSRDVAAPGAGFSAGRMGFRAAHDRLRLPGHLLGRSCLEGSRRRLRFQATRAKTTSRRTPLKIVTVCALIQPPADVRLRGGE